MTTKKFNIKQVINNSINNDLNSNQVDAKVEMLKDNMNKIESDLKSTNILLSNYISEEDKVVHVCFQDKIVVFLINDSIDTVIKEFDDLRLCYNCDNELNKLINIKPIEIEINFDNEKYISQLSILDSIQDISSWDYHNIIDVYDAKIWKEQVISYINDSSSLIKSTDSQFGKVAEFYSNLNRNLDDKFLVKNFPSFMNLNIEYLEVEYDLDFLINLNYQEKNLWFYNNINDLSYTNVDNENLKNYFPTTEEDRFELKRISDKMRFKSSRITQSCTDHLMIKKFTCDNDIDNLIEWIDVNSSNDPSMNDNPINLLNEFDEFLNFMNTLEIPIVKLSNLNDIKLNFNEFNKCYINQAIYETYIISSIYKCLTAHLNKHLSKSFCVYDTIGFNNICVKVYPGHRLINNSQWRTYQIFCVRLKSADNLSKYDYFTEHIRDISNNVELVSTKLLSTDLQRAEYRSNLFDNLHNLNLCYYFKCKTDFVSMRKFHLIYYWSLFSQNTSNKLIMSFMKFTVNATFSHYSEIYNLCIKYLDINYKCHINLILAQKELFSLFQNRDVYDEIMNIQDVTQIEKMKKFSNSTFYSPIGKVKGVQSLLDCTMIYNAVFKSTTNFGHTYKKMLKSLVKNKIEVKSRLKDNSTIVNYPTIDEFNNQTKFYSEIAIIESLKLINKESSPYVDRTEFESMLSSDYENVFCNSNSCLNLDLKKVKSIEATMDYVRNLISDQEEINDLSIINHMVLSIKNNKILKNNLPADFLCNLMSLSVKVQHEDNRNIYIMNPLSKVLAYIIQTESKIRNKQLKREMVVESTKNRLTLLKQINNSTANLLKQGDVMLINNGDMASWSPKDLYEKFITTKELEIQLNMCDPKINKLVIFCLKKLRKMKILLEDFIDYSTYDFLDGEIKTFNGINYIEIEYSWPEGIFHNISSYIHEMSSSLLQSLYKQFISQPNIIWHQLVHSDDSNQIVLLKPNQIESFVKFTEKVPMMFSLEVSHTKPTFNFLMSEMLSLYNIQSLQYDPFSKHIMFLENVIRNQSFSRNYKSLISRTTNLLNKTYLPEVCDLLESLLYLRLLRKYKLSFKDVHMNSFKFCGYNLLSSNQILSFPLHFSDLVKIVICNNKCNFHQLSKILISEEFREVKISEKMFNRVKNLYYVYKDKNEFDYPVNYNYRLVKDKFIQVFESDIILRKLDAFRGKQLSEKTVLEKLYQNLFFFYDGQRINTNQALELLEFKASKFRKKSFLDMISFDYLKNHCQSNNELNKFLNNFFIKDKKESTLYHNVPEENKLWYKLVDKSYVQLSIRDYHFINKYKSEIFNLPLINKTHLFNKVMEFNMFNKAFNITEYTSKEIIREKLNLLMFYNYGNIFINSKFTTIHQFLRHSSKFEFNFEQINVETVFHNANIYYDEIKKNIESFDEIVSNYLISCKENIYPIIYDYAEEKIDRRLCIDSLIPSLHSMLNYNLGNSNLKEMIKSGRLSNFIKNRFKNLLTLLIIVDPELFKYVYYNTYVWILEQEKVGTRYKGLGMAEYYVKGELHYIILISEFEFIILQNNLINEFPISKHQVINQMRLNNMKKTNKDKEFLTIFSRLLSSHNITYDNLLRFDKIYKGYKQGKFSINIEKTYYKPGIKLIITDVKSFSSNFYFDNDFYKYCGFGEKKWDFVKFENKINEIVINTEINNEFNNESATKYLKDNYRSIIVSQSSKRFNDLLWNVMKYLLKNYDYSNSSVVFCKKHHDESGECQCLYNGLLKNFDEITNIYDNYVFGKYCKKTKTICIKNNLTVLKTYNLEAKEIIGNASWLNKLLDNCKKYEQINVQESIECLKNLTALRRYFKHLINSYEFIHFTEKDDLLNQTINSIEFKFDQIIYSSDVQSSYNELKFTIDRLSKELFAIKIIEQNQLARFMTIDEIYQFGFNGMISGTLIRLLLMKILISLPAFSEDQIDMEFAEGETTYLYFNERCFGIFDRFFNVDLSPKVIVSRRVCEYEEKELYLNSNYKEKKLEEINGPINEEISTLEEELNLNFLTLEKISKYIENKHEECENIKNNIMRRRSIVSVIIETINHNKYELLKKNLEHLKELQFLFKKRILILKSLEDRIGKLKDSLKTNESEIEIKLTMSINDAIQGDMFFKYLVNYNQTMIKGDDVFKPLRIFDPEETFLLSQEFMSGLYDNDNAVSIRKLAMEFKTICGFLDMIQFGVRSKFSLINPTKNILTIEEPGNKFIVKLKNLDLDPSLSARYDKAIHANEEMNEEQSEIKDDLEFNHPNYIKFLDKGRFYRLSELDTTLYDQNDIKHKYDMTNNFLKMFAKYDNFTEKYLSIFDLKSDNNKDENVNLISKFEKNYENLKIDYQKQVQIMDQLKNINISSSYELQSEDLDKIMDDFELTINSIIEESKSDLNVKKTNYLSALKDEILDNKLNLADHISNYEFGSNFKSHLEDKSKFKRVKNYKSTYNLRSSSKLQITEEHFPGLMSKIHTITVKNNKTEKDELMSSLTTAYAYLLVRPEEFTLEKYARKKFTLEALINNLIDEFNFNFEFIPFRLTMDYISENKELSIKNLEDSSLLMKAFSSENKTDSILKHLLYKSKSLNII
jgi:hypothetical protein